jgi:hypothetical protein
LFPRPFRLRRVHLHQRRISRSFSREGLLDVSVLRGTSLLPHFLFQVLRRSSRNRPARDVQIRAETPKLESAARQATNSMPEGHDSSEQETPSTSTLMSLSPLSFASSLTTQQHEPPLPPTSVSSGFVAAASPSFLSTEFLPPSHDYPTFPQNPQDPIDEESFAAMEDAGHQRPRSRISSSSSTLTPIASGGSSPAERREDVEMVESEPRTRQRERTTTANESDQDVTMSGRSIVSSSKPPASFIYKLYE